MAAQGKYFVNPLLAKLLQKRDGSGPAGLKYLPEISDTTAIPEGVEYFYYTGEDHDQFVNGYIYKRTEQRETVQEWGIITPAVTEHKEKVLPVHTRYIDVLKDGYNRPVGRYYAVEQLPFDSVQYLDTQIGGAASGWRSSNIDMLEAGDFVWNVNDGRTGKFVRADFSHGYYVIESGGVNINLSIANTKTSGSHAAENLFVRADGEKLYYAYSATSVGVGVLREYSGKNYLYCDGLWVIPETAFISWTETEFTYEYEDIITPAEYGWIEREIIVTTWAQHDAQPRGVARVESPDGTKYILVEDTGTTIAGDVTALNNVTVKGNLYVEGTEVVTDVETVQSEDDFIKLRYNNPAALGEGQSGLQVLNFDGNGDTMYLVVGGDGILRLGLGNELEPVTTRDEAAAMVDGAVTVWNAQAQKIKTGPAAAELVTSEEIKTLKALSQAAYAALTTKDVTTGYFII